MAERNPFNPTNTDDLETQIDDYEEVSDLIDSGATDDEISKKIVNQQTRNSHRGDIAPSA